MKNIEMDMMKGMVNLLNEASNAYYNTGHPIMSDEQFDMRLADLKQLEEETGFIFANSPTQNVGYKVLTELKEVSHSHPMLSLDKCHTVEEIVKFSNEKEMVASVKLDGLTVSLTYENGTLVCAETRGNGHVGSDITEHIRHFLNVPLKIGKTGTYIIDGEAIITDEDFLEINKDGEYKNSRNLASGTLSVLDTSLVAKRRLRFYAWDVIDGGNNETLFENLKEAEAFGFDVTPYWFMSAPNPKKLQSTLDHVFDYAEEDGLPCDGIVFKFNNIEYGKSLGATSHHFKNGIAYKRKDDTYETELLNIEWTMGKTGVLTPTAVFKPVEIDGTTVERASLHNITMMKHLLCADELPYYGQKIEVYKANQIIPQVKRAEYDYNKISVLLDIPNKCPICGAKTSINKDNNSEVLVCTNNNCKGKLLGKLIHFASKNAMNIDGMSEATLEFLIEKGWVTSFIDIYKLDYYREPWKDYDGFGDKSVDKLLDAIEASKKTTLDKFIYALSIPLIGRSASKTTAKYFDYDYDKFIKAWGVDSFDWTKLDDFGVNMHMEMVKYYLNNYENILDLKKYLTFKKPQTTISSNNLNGKVFCITGSLIHFTNRDEAKEKIEAVGGKVVNNVSTKTDFLVCNEASNSSKYKKAQELGVKIISEEKLVNMLN